jgi:hypothetical protein
MHGIRVLSPGLEVVFVKGEFLRERFDVRGVFVEENLLIISILTNPLFFSTPKQDVQSQHHS